MPLPDTSDVSESLNPYGIVHGLKEIDEAMQKHGLKDKSIEELSY